MGASLAPRIAAAPRALFSARSRLFARVAMHAIGAAVALAVAGCLNVAEVEDHPSDPASETFASATGVVIAQMTKTESGVYYSELEAGTGDALTAAQLAVTVDYTAYLRNAAVYDAGSNVPISLDQVVPGLRSGMIGMKVGGARKIVVPSALGYGPNVRGSVPANSTLIFDIRLKSIQ